MGLVWLFRKRLNGLASMKKTKPPFLNSEQFARKVGKTRQRISQLLLKGQIAGAQRVGAVWLIPHDAKLPD